MREKKRKIPRYNLGNRMDFHGPDRMRTRVLLAHEAYDEFAERESQRKAIWRGPNGFGDNTSFGAPFAGSPDYDYFQRLLDKYIGKPFSEYYSKMCDRFKGYDRVQLDRFIEWKFNIRYRWSGLLRNDYSLEDDIIVKND